MHIDGTFVPLGPGKILVNPKRPCITGSHHSYYTYDGSQKKIKLPDMFKGWEVFVAEKPILPDSHPLFFTSPWTASCNILLIDEKRVLVEASETPTIEAFKRWGFTPIPVPFRHFLPFGGSFHCATCDLTADQHAANMSNAVCSYSVNAGTTHVHMFVTTAVHVCVTVSVAQQNNSKLIRAQLPNCLCCARTARPVALMYTTAGSGISHRYCQCSHAASAEGLHLEGCALLQFKNLLSASRHCIWSVLLVLAAKGVQYPLVTRGFCAAKTRASSLLISALDSVSCAAPVGLAAETAAHYDHSHQTRSC
eukprot:21463-Heterococcus_DN1.PRE.6